MTMVDILFNNGVLFAVKGFLLILLFLFIIFSGIVVRQVQLMNRVLTVPIAGSFRFVSYALFVFAVIIFCIAAVTL